MARLIPTIKYVCGDCGLQYDSVVEQCCGCRAILDVDNDNNLQQLKAEIAAIANDLDRYWRECKYNEFHQCTERLRQLSAV